MKILLDINVILDVLQARKPFYQSSARVLSLCAEGKIKGYVSAPSFSILDYVLSKELGRREGRSALQKIRSITQVAMVDENVIDLSLQSSFDDLEDAIQYYCAFTNHLSHIITRNKKDFKHSKLMVTTPDEFLEIK